MQDTPNKSKIPWSDFDRKTLKFRLILTGVVVFLLICAGCVTFALSQNARKEAALQAKKPTIALVNEDQPASFNARNYNFGQTFVNLVSNDSQYNWQVAARSVADKAYQDGSVQAVIYLPQNFSQNILTLQAMDPQKAQVSYKVLSSEPELTGKLLQDKIVNVLYDFNRSIVKMYYASVAGNVADAQTSMGDVVNSQGAILTTLNDKVYGPFQTTDEGYSSVVTISNSLKEQNDSWIDTQNTFTETVTKMLNENSDDLNEQLPDLTKYFDTQEQITGLNLTNANGGITRQAASDQSFYYDQYTAAYQQAAEALQKFDKTSSDGKESGLYAELKAGIADYNSLITGVSDDIGTQITELSDKQATLLGLEKALYSQFFGQEVKASADKTDFTALETKDNAKVALAELITRSFEEKNNLGTAYPDTISGLLSQVSVDVSEYTPLLDALLANQSIDAAQKQKIEEEIDVLRNYAADFGLNTGTVNFTSAPDSAGTGSPFTKQLTVSVPAGEVYTVTLQTVNGTASLAGAADDTGAALAITNPASIVLDNSAAAPVEPDPDEESSVGVPAGPAKTYTLSYEVSQADPAQEDLLTSVTATITGSSGDIVQSSTDSFALISGSPISEYVGGGNFGTITSLFSDIDTASQLIAFLYGAPGATYTGMEGITDFRGSADAKSVYRMYGNMDKLEILDHLNDEEVNQFMKKGSANIRAVTETLGTLSETLKTLKSDKSTLDAHMPGDYFSQISETLNKWYGETTDALEAQYKDWKKQDAGLLEEKAWPEGGSTDEMSLYYDKASGDSLYSMLSGIMKSSSEQAKSTADSAQIIKSNADQFTQMVETVTETQTDAKAVIDNTGSLLSTGNGAFKTSQDYYSNFATLLSNTRTSGVDNSRIFDFFAAPIATKDTTPETEAAGQSFDWRWLLVFVAGLLLGVLAKTWIRLKPKQEEA
ncbi:type VII secretion protein EsaA [Lactovum odontotermitis]